MKAHQTPAEQSIPLRIVACLMSVISIGASFAYGESMVPVIEFSAAQWAVILLSIWLAIIGAGVSYYVRNDVPPSIEKVARIAAVLVLVNLVRELWQENLVAEQFQYTRPLIHALTAASVIASFELRTSGEVLGHAVFGLVLIVLAATSGKSLVFAAAIFVYMCLGTTLLILSCRSQARQNTPSTQPLITQLSKRSRIGSMLTALILLPLTSIAVFTFIPRLDAQADSAAAHIRSIATTFIYNARKNRLSEPSKATAGDGRLQRLQRKESARILAERKQQREKEQEISRQSQPGSSTGSQTTDAALPPGKHAATAAEPPKNGGTEQKQKTEVGEISTHPPEGNSTKQNSKPPQSKDLKPEEKHKAAAPDSENASTHPKQSKLVAKQRSGQTNKEKEPEAARKPPVNKADSTARTNEEKKPPSVPDATKIPVSDPTPNGDDVILSLACNRSVYIKLTTLSDFDGLTWKLPKDNRKSALEPNSSSVIDLSDCAAVSIPAALPVMDLPQTITIQSPVGNILPIAGIPERLTFPLQVFIDQAGTVSTDSIIKPGTRYSVLSHLPVYSLQEMRSAAEGVDPDGIEAYVKLPDNQSQELVDLADRLTSDGGNRFVQAENIVKYLRATQDYQPQASHASTAANSVDDFLFHTKKGDCKAYASAFVCLCRAAGIPSRLVIGFSPGDHDPVTGATLVKSKHGHAWGEILMQPYGWVPFDPTPDGLLPARPEESYYNAERLGKEFNNYTSKLNTSANSSVQKVLSYSRTIIIVIVLAALLVGAYLLFKDLMPRLRKSLLSWRKHPATRVKDSVYRQLEKIGVDLLPSDSGADVLRKLRTTVHRGDGKTIISRSNELEVTLADFIETYNRVYFGEQDEMQHLKALGKTINTLTR